jgi:hypothetical protein
MYIFIKEIQCWKLPTTTKTVFSIRCNRVRYAKAYVNQFLALKNAIYSTIVYLY